MVSELSTKLPTRVPLLIGSFHTLLHRLKLRPHQRGPDAFTIFSLREYQYLLAIVIH